MQILQKLKEFLPKILAEIATKHPFGRRLDLGEGRCQFSPGVQDEVLEMRPGSIGSINPGPFSIRIVMSTPQSKFYYRRLQESRTVVSNSHIKLAIHTSAATRRGA